MFFSLNKGPVKGPYKHPLDSYVDNIRDLEGGVSKGRPLKRILCF